MDNDEDSILILPYHSHVDLIGKQSSDSISRHDDIDLFEIEEYADVMFDVLVYVLGEETITYKMINTKFYIDEPEEVSAILYTLQRNNIISIMPNSEVYKVMVHDINDLKPSLLQKLKEKFPNYLIKIGQKNIISTTPSTRKAKKKYKVTWTAAKK